MKMLLILILAYAFLSWLDSEPLPEPQPDRFKLCMEAYSGSDREFLCNQYKDNTK